jgi:hypothetical protein
LLAPVRDTDLKITTCDKLAKIGGIQYLELISDFIKKSGFGELEYKTVAEIANKQSLCFLLKLVSD